MAGPLIHIDWEIRPDEFEELKKALLQYGGKFAEQFEQDGALD